jgi:hypothetical protein
MIPRKTCAHAVRAVTEIAACRFASQIGICAEELDEAVVLEHVDCLQSPVMSRKMEIAVNIAAIFPVWREAAHTFIDRAFLDPKARIGPQLQIERILGAGHFVRPISKSDLNDMQHDVRTALQVKPKIMEGFSSALPAVWV